MQLSVAFHQYIMFNPEYIMLNLEGLACACAWHVPTQCADEVGIHFSELGEQPDI